MATIRGSLKTMTTNTSAVSEVWVQSTEVLPRGTFAIAPETTKIPVIDGYVEFPAYPGRATIVLTYLDTTPNIPIPVFITDEEEQTLGDIITAGREDAFQNPTEVENLIKQTMEAVNRMRGTSDTAVAAAEAAKASQEAAKVSEDNAKSSEESAAASAAQALGSQTAAKTSEDNAKKSEDAASLSEKNAKASEDAAGTSERNAKESELAAKEARDQLEHDSVVDGSVTKEKLSPELWEKIESGGVANAVSNINAEGAGKLVKVGDNGRVTTDAPVDNADVANKGYVDGAVAKGGAECANFSLRLGAGLPAKAGVYNAAYNVELRKGYKLPDWAWMSKTDGRVDSVGLKDGLYLVTITPISDMLWGRVRDAMDTAVFASIPSNNAYETARNQATLAYERSYESVSWSNSRGTDINIPGTMTVNSGKNWWMYFSIRVTNKEETNGMVNVNIVKLR